MSRRLTTELFIKKAKQIHGDKYSYNHVKYKTSIEKVLITCQIHGDFEQTPNAHLQGRGCPFCNGSFKKTNEQYIDEAVKIHGYKYDYSKMEYKNNKEKICIICPEHGEFWQVPSSHLCGNGCPACGRNATANSRRDSKDIFIQKAKDTHGDQYDYKEVEYKNARTPVCIICPKHGKFHQTPDNHLRGQKCPKCSGNAKMNNETFINRARKVHGNKYDYHNVVFKNTTTKVEIICPKHGSFLQSPSNHLAGKGCAKCGGTQKKTFSDFVKEANLIHSNKYIYDANSFVDCRTPIKIMCPEHGVFLQAPYSHLNGSGCPDCGKIVATEKRRSNTKEFIDKSIRVHGDRYDYSQVNYVNWETKICIVCLKHGKFWQTPNNHLRGEGCPKCKASQGEKNILNYLRNAKISFKHEVPVKIEESFLRYDFSLTKNKGFIEFDGEQHFKSVDFFGGTNGLKSNVERDTKKNAYCKENDIPLLRIRYDQINDTEGILDHFLANPDFYKDRYNPYLTNEEYYLIREAV